MMRDFAFAGMWLIFIPLSMISAPAGVLLWIWVALLSPNELLYGFANGIPFNKLVAVPTLLMMAFRREKRDFYLDTIMFLLIIFALAATMSNMNSLDPNSSEGSDLYQKVIKDIILAFVISAVMTTRHRLHLMVLALTIALGFLGVKEGLIALLTAGGHHIEGSLSIGDNNSLATALLMVIPLSYYVMQQCSVKLVKWALFGMIALSAVTVVMTFSRGGFIGMVVLSAFIVKNSKSKLLTMMLVLIAAILIFSFAPSAWFDRLSTIKQADNDGSFMGRVVAWKLSLLIALDHPFTGGGMHAVQRMVVWTAYTPLIDMVNFIATPPPDDFPHAAHSIFFEVLGDMGFTGLGVFLLLLASAFWTCRRTYSLAKGHPSLLWAASLSRMLEISFVIYVVTAAALSMAYFEMTYVLFALASRLHRTVQQTLIAEATLADLAAIRGKTGRQVGNPIITPPRPDRWSGKAGVALR